MNEVISKDTLVLMFNEILPTNPVGNMENSEKNLHVDNQLLIC